MSDEKIEIQSVTTPGHVTRVRRDKYDAMHEALLATPLLDEYKLQHSAKLAPSYMFPDFFRATTSDANVEAIVTHDQVRSGSR